MARNKTHGKRKRSKAFGIIKFVGGALITLLLLFLVLDNFTLYWYMLFNGDDALERRRQGAGVVEDSGYVDPSVDGTGTNGSNLPNGGNGNYGQTGMLGRAELEAMSPEDAVAAVTRTLTDEQIKDPETAWRVFIYLMDRHGFVPNAIIGAMSYVKAEGAGMGTFTYESYWLCPGPDGAKSSRHLGNQDWLDWLDGPGFKWAEANYGSRREDGENLHYAAIGIGSVQSSDVWDGPGNKTTSNATQLIEAANAKGLYWQDPGFQMPNLMTRYFVSSEPFGKSAWDVDQCPGVDPTTDNNVTAFEWSKRVLCGVGYPGWKSCSMSDDNKHVVSHAAGIEECADLYEKYSKKDPWFYTDRPAQSGGTVQGGSIKQVWPCGACGAKNENESTWLCPFCGPDYDNTTPQGLLIARMAVLFSGDAKVKYKGASKQQTIDDPGLASDPTLQYYRYAQASLEQNYWASCDRFASLCILLAGADPNYIRGGVGHQRAYMHGEVVIDWSPVTWAPGGHPERWQLMGAVKNTQLQPGDIIINPGTGSDALENYKTGKHIMVWVGDNVASERWKGTTNNLAEASYFDYYPRMRCANTTSKDISNYIVYRCIQPQWSSTKWDTFIAAYGSKFPEIPSTYPYKP